MPLEILGQPKVNDEENVHMVGHAAAVDAVNSEFYGRYPYPWRPTNFLYPANATQTATMLSQNVGSWDCPVLPSRPRIWVAGCGTNQAVVTALHYPQASIVGSDLSQPSLDLAQSTLRAMGLRNVELRNESINEASHEGEFDFIVCTGVIHHNSDPEGTLRVLNRALKPDGLLELMVYNRFHRLMNTAVQKAVRLLRSDDSDWDSQMELLTDLIQGLPPESEAAMHLSRFIGEPDARIADSLLQPVEHSYTVESLSACVESCALKILIYHVSEWDKADERALWNMQWATPRMQARYDSLADLSRWQLTNLLLFDRSPMLWFYLQKQGSNRAVKTEAQITEEFLDRTFRVNRQTQRCYTLQQQGDQGTYKLSSRQTPYADHPTGIDRALLLACEQGASMRAAFESCGGQPGFHAATRARIHLTTTAYPFLFARPQ